MKNLLFLLKFMCCFGGLGVIGMVSAYMLVNGIGVHTGLYDFLEATKTIGYFILFWACLVAGVFALLLMGLTNIVEGKNETNEKTE